MFKNNNSQLAANINSPERLNRIVEGTKVKGEINSESNIRIDGVVVGTIHTKGKLVIGPSGKIVGDVVCDTADIEGALEGTLKVNELLTLRATAKVQGDMMMGKFVVESGAEFNGTSAMGGVVKDFNRSKKEKEQEELELAEKMA